ncbi:MAG: LysM peptidoglycan-binding domain-containing protein [Verrucomicrobia bacterium]|nr:MAG: LysM peptidoglycan-binding domain-containing protein [Verrucomicrobiota bacterium]
MKLTHVFGLVAAVHAAAITLFIATPGCRSANKSKPMPSDTAPRYTAAEDTTPETISAAPVESMSYDDLNAPSPGSLPSPTVVSREIPESIDTIGSSPVRASAPVSAAPLAPTPAGPAAASAVHLVASGDSLWSIARKHGISVAELAAANRLAPSAKLRIGQALTVPAQATSAEASAAPGIAAAPANAYSVVSGDTLGSIARRNGVTVAALRAANNLSGDALRIDQKLVIPAGGTRRTSSSAAPSALQSSAETYSIVAGDTLGGIARRTGVRVGDLALLNNITDPAKLRIGQVLKLPAGANAPAASASTSTAATSAAPIIIGAAPLAPESVPVELVTPVEPIAPVEQIVVPVIRIE